MNVILLGPPGAGKGQAQLIVKNHNYFQLSTGDLLRAEIKKKTKIGEEIENLISKGNFVSDEIVEDLIKSTIENLKFRDRIIFDGYPRNVIQAKKLDEIVSHFSQKIDLIIFLNVPRDIVKKRIMGRMTCEKCNVTLSEYFNVEEIELHPCGKEFLKKRKDDKEEILMHRYDTYMNETKPVLDFYTNHDKFNELDGSMKMSEISNKINEILNV